MFNEPKWPYQEEAGDEGDAGGSLLDGATGGESDDLPGDGTGSDWFYSENVKGEGDKPEYLQDKYKSVAAQAEAYPELAKKMGAHTGAPDEYDLSLPEGANDLIQVDPENEGVEAFLEAAKEGGINQEFMSQAMAFHVAAMQDALGDLIPNKEAELASLGKDALGRINNVADWGQANLSEEQFDMLREVTSRANGVELVEALIAKTRGAKVPDGTAPTNNGMTEAKLREMRYATDDAGNLKIQIDPAYKNMVDTAYGEFYGKEPRKDVVSM